jgi:hypothetical protein
MLPPPGRPGQGTSGWVHGRIATSTTETYKPTWSVRWGPGVVQRAAETPGRCCDRSPCGPEADPADGVGSQAKPVLENFWRTGRTVRCDAVIPERLQHVGASTALHRCGSAGDDCGSSADGIPSSSPVARCSVGSRRWHRPTCRGDLLGRRAAARHVGVGAQAGRRDRGEVMPALVEATTPPSRAASSTQPNLPALTPHRVVPELATDLWGSSPLAWCVTATA